jgi:predicted O-methyltransferase YrrM
MVTNSVLLHFVLWNLNLSSAETQTTSAERDALARHASGRERLAEVGVWHGVTTCRLRKAMSPKGLLFAIDPYPVGRLGFSAQQVIAHREVRQISNGRIEWLRETGVGAANRLRETGQNIEFVFIDGDHSYDGLKGDWENWKSLVLPGGVIALHDSRSTPIRNIDDAGSVKYTESVILKDPTFSVVEAVDSLTVLRRAA